MLTPHQLFTQLRHDLSRMRDAKSNEEFEASRSFAKKDLAQFREHLRAGTLDAREQSMLTHSVKAYEEILAKR